MTKTAYRAIGVAVAAFLPLAANADEGPADPRAQTLIGTYGAPAVRPQRADALIPASVARPAARAGVALPGPIADVPLRTHLGVAPEALTMEGEHAVLKVPLFVSRSEAGRTTDLNVGAATAIDALEDTSSLEVFINGSLVGRVPPRYDAPSEARFRLEPGNLVPGFNEVMFVARHQHRVDCSVASTYELWTKIVPELTYFAGTALEGAAPELGELPSRLGRNGAPATLKLSVDAASTPAKATALVRLVDVLVLDGFIAQPRIVAGDAAEPGIAIGLAPSLEAALAAEGAVAFADIPNLVLTRSPDGATTGLVLAGGPADVERTLTMLEERAASRVRTGSPRGLVALDAAFGRRLNDAQSVTFGELGLETQRFAGRRFSIDVPARLPGDFYQADTGNVLLYLDGAYVGGFIDGTLLKVKVNGVQALTLPLGESSPTTFAAKELRIPLGFFHAGLNKITIEADLLTPSDLVCAPENAPVRTPRLAIAASSRLVVPRMPRVGVAPNLAATLADGQPYTLADTPTDVFLVGDRATSLVTATQLFAEITANTQSTSRYELNFRMPAEGEDGVLVGPPAALPAFAQEMVGYNSGPSLDDPVPMAEPALGPTAAMSPERAPVPSPISSPIAAGFTLPFGPTPDATAPSDDLLALPEADPAVDALPLPQRTGPSLLARLGERVGAGASSALASLTTTPTEAPRTYLQGNVVLAQSAIGSSTTFEALTAAVLPQRPPRTVTVVAADRPDALADALTGATSAPVRFDPSGQYYAHGASSDRAIPVKSDGVLYATRAPGPMNLRLVMAGWLSNNSRIYVGLVAAGLVVLGFLTFRAARAGRDRHAS